MFSYNLMNVDCDVLHKNNFFVNKNICEKCSIPHRLYFVVIRVKFNSPFLTFFFTLGHTLIHTILELTMWQTVLKILALS